MNWRCAECEWPISWENAAGGARLCSLCRDVKLVEMALAPQCRLCHWPLATINALARVKECFCCTSMISALNSSLYWQGVVRQEINKLRRLRDESEAV